MTEQRIAAEALYAPERSLHRKVPVQPRAARTVDRIKRAMLAIIAEEGYAAASTNRVAERAGVNIATLYRYFPNRPSIALAVYEDASSRLARVVHDWFLANAHVPFEKRLDGLILKVVDFVEREHVALLRLSAEVPELRETGQAMSLENLAYDTSRVYLEQHLGPLDRSTMSRTLFFVQNLGMGMIRRYVLDRPAGLSRKRFVSELSSLIETYLRGVARNTATG